MRTLVGAIFAVLVALACSACGSTHAVRQSRPVRATDVAHVVPFTLPPAVNLVVLPAVHGVGNERLGTFTPHGTVDFELSCKGKGFITIVLVSRTGPCDGSPVGVGVPGEEGKRMNLVVHTAPGTTWRLAVGEEIPGSARVLVQRTASGSKSLGPFRLRGATKISLSCTGHGTLDLQIRSRPSIPGIGTSCPEQGIGTTIPVADGRSAHFVIDAGQKVHWSIAISEQPAK